MKVIPFLLPLLVDSARIRRAVVNQYVNKHNATAASTAVVESDRHEATDNADNLIGATHVMNSSNHFSIVDNWLNAQPRGSFGLLQTYGEGNRHDVYDNSLAAIYYIERGQMEPAKAIIDAMLHEMYPGESDPEGAIASGKEPTLLGAAYDEHGNKHKDDGTALDVGNNAWVGIAMARYAAAAKSACLWKASTDLLNSIKRQFACNDDFGGYMGRVGRNYRSIEHNIDMVAFARIIGAEDVLASAKKFVHSMGERNKGKFYALGTGDKVRCDMSINTQTVATDSITWNILAEADDDHARRKAGLGFVMDPNGGMWETERDQDGNEYSGVRFSEHGEGIQWENTAGFLNAMQHYVQLHSDDMGLAGKIQTIKTSLTKLLNVRKHIPGSIRPGGSSSGLGWSYFPIGHLVATAWTGIALMDKNPYSAEFAASKPDPATCGGPPGPSPSPSPSPSGSACSAHSQCAHLAGNCCPTDGGTMLGCCSR